MFNVDFNAWILQMLPTFLRRRLVFALCRAMCAPVVSLYGRFMAARRSHNYALTHNGQVCYLRAALNDAFNTKGFNIVDYDDGRGEWLFAKSEDFAEQLYAVDEQLKSSTQKVPILYDEARLNLAQNLFIVQVPSLIYATQLDKVKSVVGRYRLLTKTPIYTPIS